MKKFILPICSLLLFAACSSSDKELETSKQLVLTAPAVANADTAQMLVEEQAPAVAPAPIINNYYAAPKPVVTPKRRAPKPAAPVYEDYETAPVVNVPVPDVAGTTNTDVSTGTAETGTETATVPAEEKKKKGISDAAKGAVIGGVGGAVAGAVIGKNGKGAVIGAVIGAAGGYILGRKSDKKSGRIELAQ